MNADLEFQERERGDEEPAPRLLRLFRRLHQLFSFVLFEEALWDNAVKTLKPGDLSSPPARACVTDPPEIDAAFADVAAPRVP